MVRSAASPCPSENALLAFVEGELEAEERAAIVAHVGGCDACLAAVGGSASQGEPTLVAPSLTVSFRPGDIVAGRYEIRRFIAHGGMGEVYEAQDQLVEERVALKTMLLATGDHPRALEQTRREVVAARAINHRGVCRVFDMGEHITPGEPAGSGRRFFLTMEFLEGSTLGHRIRTSGALDTRTFKSVARQLVAGLTAAHEAGVVHRDFKSDNVMLLPAADGVLPRAMIMDFGLAKPARRGVGAATTGGIMVGSAAYMAPEQVEGLSVGDAADVYALGVVLFECATGRLPFIASTPLATAAKRLTEPPPPPRGLAPDLDAGLDAIILRCMARAVGDRFPSMRAVGTALADLENGGARISTTTTVPPVAAAPRRPARRWAWQLLVAGAIGAAAVTLLLARRPTRGQPHAPDERLESPPRSAPAPVPAPTPSPQELSTIQILTGEPATISTESSARGPAAKASGRDTARSARPTPVVRHRQNAAGLTARPIGDVAAAGQPAPAPAQPPPAPTAADPTGSAADAAPIEPVAPARSRSTADGFGNPFAAPAAR